MQELPEWLLLIEYWVTGGAHNGYTFPFLMGARAKQKGIEKVTQTGLWPFLWSDGMT
ncbi:MAG: hypothetical protein MUO77_07295 [Anaerolineales bacterium]|nr:hypothetical protein [Anaerolineales bacterium]